MGTNLREQITERRKGLNLTQADLALKAGITQAQLSNFESGKSELNSSTLDKIFEVLQMHYSQPQSAQWELATVCAQVLKSKGIKDASSISKEEMAEIAGCEDILLLQVISQSLYDKYQASNLINEHHTYNYFLTLVNFKLAVLK